MNEQHVNEIIGRIKSTSIESRLGAIVEAKQLFNGFFNPTDSLAEWAKKAITVETFYNLIREELKQPHVRIGKSTEDGGEAKVTKAKTSPPAEKKPASPKKKEYDIAAMTAEFAAKMAAQLGEKKE